MNYTEYSIVSTKTYIEYCDYLLEKYGAVNGDYFSANFVPNMNIKRRDENLFIHHMREDKVANLSNVDIARANDFEYQKAHNLVYANLLEHILLHIMIGVSLCFVWSKLRDVHITARGEHKNLTNHEIYGIIFI